MNFPPLVPSWSPSISTFCNPDGCLKNIFPEAPRNSMLPSISNASSGLKTLIPTFASVPFSLITKLLAVFGLGRSSIIYSLVLLSSSNTILPKLLLLTTEYIILLSTFATDCVNVYKSLPPTLLASTLFINSLLFNVEKFIPPKSFTSEAVPPPPPPTSS